MTSSEINKAEMDAEYKAIVDLWGGQRPPKRSVVLEYKSVTGVKCPFCAQIIISHHTHDLHRCKCGYTFVDGGRSYLRFGYGFGFSQEERPEWASTHEKILGVPEVVEIRINEQGVIG